jgi:hypothetical protein
MPFYPPQVLQANERAPIPCSFTIFTSYSHLESLKEPRGASATMSNTSSIKGRGKMMHSQPPQETQM